MSEKPDEAAIEAIKQGVEQAMLRAAFEAMRGINDDNMLQKIIAGFSAAKKAEADIPTPEGSYIHCSIAHVVASALNAAIDGGDLGDTHPTSKAGWSYVVFASVVAALEHLSNAESSIYLLFDSLDPHVGDSRDIDRVMALAVESDENNS